MKELFILSALLCFVTEGAPFSGNGKRSDEKVTDVGVDIGKNLTLKCEGYNEEKEGGMEVMWVRDGYDMEIVKNTQILKDGSLYFEAVQKLDSGLYSCRPEPDIASSPFNPSKIRVRVRTPPLSLKNVTILPSTILALVIWEISDDGGYPISSFQIRYRLKNSSEFDWKSCQPNLISPNVRQIDIYHLHPNSYYIFEMWANNAIGRGPSTIKEAFTHNDLQEIELGKHLLEGVDTFDTRAWMVAVGVVMGTLFLLGVATCCLFYKEYSLNWSDLSGRGSGDEENIELMPNIILNPAYDYDFQPLETSEPDENSNDTTPLRVNNNSVIHPTRV